MPPFISGNNNYFGEMIMMNTMFASAAAVAQTAGMAVADYTLTVLHTNDFHARFEPISIYNSGCGEGQFRSGPQFGRLQRIK